MATLEELVISLVAETSGLRAELDKAAKATTAATGKMDDAIKSFSDNSSKKVGFFESAMSTMVGFISSSAVIGAFHKLVDLGIEAVAAFKEEQLAINELSQSMINQGVFTASLRSEYIKLASSLEAVTTFSDDQIISAEAQIQSMIGQHKVTKELLKATLDLAAGKKIDLATAANLVGKTIGTETDALSRQGVVVKEAVGINEKMANVIEAVNSKFKDRSTAAAKDLGVMDQLKNSWSNFLENTGSLLAPFVTEMAKATKATLDFFNSLAAPSIKTLSTQELTDELARLTAEYDKATLKQEKFLESGKEFGGADTLIASLKDRMAAIQAQLDQNTSDQKASADAEVAINKAKIGELEKIRRENLNAMVTALAEQTTALDSNYKYQQELLQASLDAGLASTEGNHYEQQTLQAEFFAAKSEALTTQQEDELAALEEWHSRHLDQEFLYQNAKTALQNKQTLESMKLSTDIKNWEIKTNKEKLSDLSATFSAISTLSTAHNKGLAAIGKAAAIADATIQGYLGVQRALGSAPPPFNFALAALVGTAAAANVAKIAGVGLAGGIDSVPGSGTKDNFPAVLAPGERVVTADQNRDLTDFLSNQGGGGGNVVIELRLQDQMVEFIEAKILERQRIGISLLQGAV